MKSEPVAKAAFITFYSFKGGVGRSMALINTAGILAGVRGFRILVLDLDLEAPGLSYLDPDAPEVSGGQVQAELPLQPGFVDLLTDAKERAQQADLFALDGAALEAKYTREIKLPDPLREFPDGSLHIMPAGRFDPGYARRLDALSLNELYRAGAGEPLIRAFKKKLAESGRYDYVLVDSRTGISEGAGICTRDLADHVMILSGLNRQNVEGTSEFLREFRAATDGKKSFQIILSPMPNGEDKLLEDRRKEAERSFGKAWRAKVELSLEIPYHPQLALTEEPHIFRSRRGYLFEAYRTIERRMLEALGHDAGTLRAAVQGALAQEDYSAALRDLQRLVRLTDGRAALSQLALGLAFGVPPSAQSKIQGEPAQKKPALHKILDNETGRAVIEFVVENLPLDEKAASAPMALLSRLEERDAGLAERLHQRIITAAPSNAHSLSNYAVFLEKRDRFEEAEAFYKRAVGADAKDAGILANYADFLEKRERLEETETFFKRAAEADPKDAGILSNYAVFLAKRERLEEAEALFKRAAEADPKDAGVLGNYAVLLGKRERFEEAETFFKRAVEAEPKHANNFGNYAGFLANRGRFEEAEAFYKRAVEADPKDAGILGNYAVFLANRERFEEAEAFYKRAVEADPKHANNLRNYALLLEKRERFEEAEAFHKRAVEADPKHTGNLGNYALFLEKRERFEEAEALYKRAVEADPKHTNSLGNYALFLQKRERFEEAEAFFKRAVETDPKHANNLGNYGQFLVGLGRLQEGVDRLVEAFGRLEPSERGDTAEVCFSLWLANRMQGLEGEEWERRFKFLVERGFKRYSSSFEGMLKQARALLPAENLEYAMALAGALLDESKVAELARYPRWQALQPLGPEAPVAKATS